VGDSSIADQGIGRPGAKAFGQRLAHEAAVAFSSAVFPERDFVRIDVQVLAIQLVDLPHQEAPEPGNVGFRLVLVHTVIGRMLG
jgi:hypothetical protein